MPCWTKIESSCDLKLGNQTLIEAALKSLFGSVTKINGVFHFRVNGDSATLANGEVTIRGYDSNAAEVAQKIKGEFAVQVVKAGAKQHKFKFQQRGPNKFRLTRG